MKFDREYNYGDIKAHCGDVSQISRITASEQVSDTCNRQRILNFHTASGLNFTVTPDSGLDISYADYKGINLALMLPGGVYKNHSTWERGLAGGLLVTAGLSNICPDQALGSPNGTARQMTQNLAWDAFWLEDEFHLIARGEVHEIFAGTNHIRRRRTITVLAGEPKIHIRDHITNLGFEKVPFQVAYRVQPGFPVVCATSRFSSSTEFVTPLDTPSKDERELFRFTQPPTPNYQGKTFIHKCSSQRNGLCHAAIINPSLNDGIGIGVTFDSFVLPHLTQYKMMAPGNYTMTMEPTNSYEISHERLKALGIIKYLEPEEEQTVSITIDVLEGVAGIRRFEELIRANTAHEPQFGSPLK